MYYVRAGQEVTLTITDIGGLPTFSGVADFVKKIAIDISGNDTVKLMVVSVAPNGSNWDLTTRITMPFDAEPGLRDLLINNSTNNAAPTIFPDAVTVLPAGKVGSQIWFFTARATNAQLGDGAYSLMRPSDYGAEFTDTFDELLPNMKRTVYDTNVAVNTCTPRIYTWDCITDNAKYQPLADPFITGTVEGGQNTGIFPDTANWADLNFGNPETGPKEGEVLGYVDKKDDGTWVKPIEFMVNRADSQHVANLPHAWQQNAAAAAAPDEFQNGNYNVNNAPDGSADVNQRATSNNGPNYTCYRGTMGFPKVGGALTTEFRDYRDGSPSFGGHNPDKKIPGHFHHRKPYFYIGTAHHFYSREALSALLNKRPPASIWSPSLYQSMNVDDYYTSFFLQAIQLIGLPLYYRTQNSDTTTADWTAAQAAQPLQFEPFNDLIYGANGLTYHEPGQAASAKSVVYITIDPIEVVLPGPRWGGGLSNEATYRRNLDAYTRNSKIKVWYQDLWSHDDLDYETGFGTNTADQHVLSDPVLLMEAYCPRIDMKWDYTDWANGGFDIPGNETPFPTNTGLWPYLTMETQPFEWTLICKSVEQARSNAGKRGPGQEGYYDNTGRGALNAAQTLFAEFTGYKCKLVVNRSYWTRTKLNTTVPAVNNNAKAAGFTKRDATPPYWGDYWEAYEGREGGFFCPSGYLEVVDDD